MNPGKNPISRRLHLLYSVIVFASAVCLSCLLGGCAGSPSILDAHSSYAEQIATFTWVLFAIALVVFVIVMALLLLAVLRARRTEPHPAQPVNDRRALTLILLGGALAPALILFPLMLISISIDQASASPAGDFVVQVTAHQWWWEVNYPQQGITTANEIHIPSGQPVTVQVTSADVTHSFWVPQLHGKIDTIPGVTNTITLEADTPGTYRGQCAEYCGLQHAHMAFLVIADTPDDFQRWVAQEQQPAATPTDSLALEGQKTFLGAACIYCHTVKGTSANGKVGPDLTHLASRRTIGAGTLDNNPGNLAGWIVNSQAIKPGNLMPPMNLTSDQVQALLAYLETLQ